MMNSVAKYNLETRFNFDIKRKIIMKGESAVYKKWQGLVPSLTKQDFLTAVEWLCNDPLDEYGRTTRKIGLSADGIKKLIKNKGFWTTSYYTVTENSNIYRLWNGAIFSVPCNDSDFADANGMIKRMIDWNISPNDKV